MDHFRVAVSRLVLNYCKGNEFDLHKNTQLICAPGLALKLHKACSNTKRGAEAGDRDAKMVVTQRSHLLVFAKLFSMLLSFFIIKLDSIP